jgi:hypothetical protein
LVHILIDNQFKYVQGVAYIYELAATLLQLARQLKIKE